VQDHGQRCGKLCRVRESLTVSLLDAHAGGRGARRLGLFAFLLLVPPFVTGGCKNESKVMAQYGDPVGIELEAHGAVPRLKLAIAVTKGRDVTKVVSSVAGAIYAAAATCPSFVAATLAASATRLEFSAKDKVIYPPQAVPDEESAACMLGALSGKSVEMDRSDKLDIIVETRPSKGDGSSGP
jgi:hypothetical protein